VMGGAGWVQRWRLRRREKGGVGEGGDERDEDDGDSHVLD
jgi:hypothetical protein